MAAVDHRWGTTRCIADSGAGPIASFPSTSSSVVEDLKFEQHSRHQSAHPPFSSLTQVGLMLRKSSFLNFISAWTQHNLLYRLLLVSCYCGTNLCLLSAGDRIQWALARMYASQHLGVFQLHSSVGRPSRDVEGFLIGQTYHHLLSYHNFGFAGCCNSSNWCWCYYGFEASAW